MLRPATAADVPAAEALVREGFGSYRAFGIPGWEPPEEPMRGMAERLAGGWGTVYDERGSVVGFGAFQQATEGAREGADVPGLAHVWAIFVRETHWGAGVARALLAAVTDEASGRGYREARLFTPALQARARRFYAREGWTEVGEPFAVELLGLDMVELRRPL
ncbi:MAG: family N-acetyltransferase [Solirubrobacterales bacterium]|nr:family N-acetyltransferase [Solirubrobacterales bacterium]